MNKKAFFSVDKIKKACYFDNWVGDKHTFSEQSKKTTTFFGCFGRSMTKVIATKPRALWWMFWAFFYFNLQNKKG